MDCCRTRWAAETVCSRSFTGASRSWRDRIEPGKAIMRPGLRSRPWAGVDLGSYSIKLVASMGGNGISAKHWTAEIPVPVPETERDTPAGREAIAKAIAQGM